uniref:Uncharacterized protein n=1 Tax=Knipowitschia caucasica TaxID=637954 RepID=A0AAV2L8F5_KNICA
MTTHLSKHTALNSVPVHRSSHPRNLHSNHSPSGGPGWSIAHAWMLAFSGNCASAREWGAPYNRGGGCRSLNSSTITSSSLPCTSLYARCSFHRFPPEVSSIFKFLQGVTAAFLPSRTQHLYPSTSSLSLQSMQFSSPGQRCIYGNLQPSPSETLSGRAVRSLSLNTTHIQIPLLRSLSTYSRFSNPPTSYSSDLYYNPSSPALPISLAHSS